MSLSDHVVLLVGGVGGAKLAVGLAQVLPPERLTIVVNTGDDFEHLGLRVSPDLDTVMYSLSGIANPETGWGLADDTFQAMQMVADLGGPDWFRLGDRDLGASMMRTHLLTAGATLSEVTRQIARSLGVRHPIAPMSDHPVRTWLDTDQGEMGFQEYFVRYRWQPHVSRICFKGAEAARPAQAVADAFASATLVIFGPSNPYLSIDSILAVPGIREAIEQGDAPCVAVSPIVGGQAIKGPAAKLMQELGLEASPLGVAQHYEGLLDGIIIDAVDRRLSAGIEKLGVRVGVLDTIMTTATDKARLANKLLVWAEENQP